EPSRGKGVAGLQLHPFCFSSLFSHLRRFIAPWEPGHTPPLMLALKKNSAACRWLTKSKPVCDQTAPCVRTHGLFSILAYSREVLLGLHNDSASWRHLLLKRSLFVCHKMESIRMWLAQKLWFFKSRVLGLSDTEPPPLSKWSSESPFRTWNIYSKAFLAVSILLFVAFFVLTRYRRKVIYSKQLVRRRPAPRSECAPAGQLLHTWLEGFALFLVFCMMLTLPWEWVRLYQIEVAKKMAVLSE
ncbi:hypothetical protein NDU88_001544, partial [Pleurodeles waltl]